MAGDKVEIARAGFLMIHNTWVFAIGDRHDLSTVAGQLAAFDEVMAELYALRAKADAKEIGAMMDRETWISGRAAIDQGFADALLDADQIEASDQAKAKDAKAVTEFAFMARKAGYSRSQANALRNRLTSKPGAADDDMPSAVETMANLTGWAKSLSAKMEN